LQPRDRAPTGVKQPATPIGASPGNGSVFDALEPHSQGVYVNFTSDGAADRVRAARSDPQRLGLTALKATYDPSNDFRMNANIPPRAS
jgi:hypothetical protein